MLSSSSDSISVTIARHTYPLSNDFVAKELFWSGVESYTDERPERADLANFFAESSDYRLREVAAQSTGLTRKSALRLSKDVCYSVRNHISQNSQALELLPAKALILLGQSDHSIAANLVNSFTPFDEATRRNLAVKFIRYFSEDEAFKIKDILTSLQQERLKPILAQKVERRSVSKIHMDIEGYEEGVATLNCADMRFSLSSDEVTSIMDHLKTEVPKFSKHISALLDYPDSDVLEYVAQHIVTNPEHLEALLATKSRRIGRSALNNEAANKIGSRALKAFFGSDVAMIEDVLTSDFDVLQTRIAQIYRQAPDPAIREIVRRYELEAQSCNAWLKRDEDDFEDDEDEEIGTIPMPPGGVYATDDDEDDSVYVGSDDFDEIADDSTSSEGSRI